MSLTSCQSSPRTNWLLSALPSDDFAHLEPYLELIELHKGRVVYETDESMPFVYFSHDGVVSLTTVLPAGKAIEMVVLGYDAMFGFASTLVTRRSLGNFVVQIPGTASRIDIDVLHRAFEEQPSLRELLLRYEEALLAEALQAMACNIVHSVMARCCRWILTMRDPADPATLPFTHEHLSQVLRVQRSTVSLVTFGLQSMGLIHQDRGVITVTDRSGLEQIACGCYEIARQRSQQLSPAQNRETHDAHRG
ncbi:Crp/Fnr family transcriptional regulator [Microvirga vignae]|uniref:Crp/Fnr family transcriptional regulator n=1 Tax=Microvirga vignae TaxID=1225564 RepID=A0A0H1R681_9HYPH|nr:Crp/Fnr family transcriptional regulator [Microvirga vignae]KLK90544.1 Crp/Fnr family transcriptional regulator [Microvirga vignae]